MQQSPAWALGTLCAFEYWSLAKSPQIGPARALASLAACGLQALASCAFDRDEWVRFSCLPSHGGGVPAAKKFFQLPFCWFGLFL